MPILLPCLSFIFIFLLFFTRRGERNGLRLAWLGAGLSMGALIAASCEVLSLFHALTRAGLAAFWGGVLLLAAAATLLQAGRGGADRLGSLSGRALQRVLEKLGLWFGRQGIFGRSWLNLPAGLVPAGLAAATFIIALVAPPNNTDAMVYHLSRVAHWAQQGSVAHFATSTLRELYLNPLAEYAALHTYLLAGSDRFVNLVQWFSYLGAAAAAALLAEALGAARKGQYLAALFAFSLPQALLQATSAQNDLTFSFFALAAVYFIIRFIQEGPWRWLLTAALASALALLAKSTALIVLAPFLLWLGARLLRRWRSLNLAAYGLALLIALLLLAPFYARNTLTFGSPLGPASETPLYSNQVWGLNVLASNLLRNTAINLTYTPGVSAALEKAVNAFHGGLGLDASDARTTWQGYTFAVKPFTISEDWSGSPLHIWLAAAALLGLALRRARRGAPSAAGGLALCLLGGFVLFSGYLRWQPWNNRLELVFFLLAAPLFGLAVERVKLLPLLCSAGLAVACLPYFFFNPTKPLTQDWNIFTLQRIEMMIRNKDILAPYINSSMYIDDQLDCGVIGLDLANGYWEYPFWNMLVDPAAPRRALLHVNVSNESAALEDAQPAVCAMIVVNEQEKVGSLAYRGERFARAFQEGVAAVYVREP